MELAERIQIVDEALAATNEHLEGCRDVLTAIGERILTNGGIYNWLFRNRIIFAHEAALISMMKRSVSGSPFRVEAVASIERSIANYEKSRVSLESVRASLQAEMAAECAAISPAGEVAL